MKRFETNNKTREELTTALVELRGQLSKLEFELAEKKLKDTTSLNKTKKDIARILTAMNANK